jgi:cellulose synthase/poly-beta-1,6-N-acetylglucosamine synthase-like glycosyltransferase
MAIVALKAKPKDKDYSYQPFVSIIVPTYNEENVIRKRIENLLELDYPSDRYEVIIVDSGSSDKTTEITAEMIIKLERENPKIRLIKEDKRRGKASAINTGKDYTKGEIVLVTDANSIFDKNALREMMPHFKNPKVGAVGGRYCVKNPENQLAASESFYWDLEYIMRRGESSLDSACLFHGEINAWRKGLVHADINVLSEDLDICIAIRRKGYKIEYEPNAIVYEPSATNIKDQIIRRKKVVIGTIKCMIKHGSYFIFTKKDLYNLLIFPSHKVLAIFSPFTFLLVLVLYITLWNFRNIEIHFILSLFIFILFFAVLMVIKSKLSKHNKVKSFFRISSLPDILFYVLLNEYLILLGWKDFIFNNYSVLWEKAESARKL